MKQLSGTVGLLLVALALVACRGGDELTQAVEDLKSRDLAIMVLTQEEWGDLADGFVIDPDSGPQDNEAAADDSINPDDDSTDFDEAGRETGYELSFDHPDFMAAFAAGEGVLNLRSEVELFATADEAKVDLERKIGELSQYEGEDIEGVVVGSHEEFDVSIKGDESGGLTFDSSIPALDLTAYSTVVYFRIDRLSAAVIIGAADDVDVRSEAETAARTLDERIRGVALGEIDEEPVEIPAERADSGSGGDGDSPGSPPAGVPDISNLALRLEDLPRGFSVEEEGFEPPPDIEFHRNFEVSSGISVSIDGTETVAIQHTVSRFETAIEAQFVVSAFEAILEGGGGEAALLESLSDTLGDDATVREFRAIDVSPMGDQAVVYAGAVETALGDIAVVFSAVRADRAVSLMNFTALGKGFEFRDLVPLLRTGAERIAAAR